MAARAFHHLQESHSGTFIMELVASMNQKVVAMELDRLSNPSECVATEMSKVAHVDLEEAVRLHYRKVYHFSLHLCRNEADAADLTQHAYEMLAKKAHRIADASKVKSWLHTTVYRKFVDMHRHKKRFPKVELVEEELDPEEQEEMHGARVDAQTALRALHGLEDELRAPLALFYLEDLSYKDIARTLELPMGTVMSRLYRGKKELYQSLTGAKAS